MTKHARLSASSSAKWLNCPGSIKAEEPYPNVTNKFAEEGTKAHELAESLLRNNTDSSIHYDDDMYDHVQRYIEYVNDISDNCSSNGSHKPTRFLVEHKVDYSRYAPSGFGTADCIIADPVNRIVHIIDLKYGMGRVEADGNTQLMLYALGFLSSYSHSDEIVFVKLHIVQPRIPDGFSTYGLSVKELEKFGEYVKIQAALTLQDNPERIAGEKQCQWCRAKHDCPALANMLDKTTLTEFSDIDAPVNLPDIVTLDDSQRKRILDNKALIVKFLDAVESSVFNDISSGEKFDGYKIVEGRGRRQWVGDADYVLREKLGDKAYKKSLIGIGEAEKLLSKSEVNRLLVKAPGKPTLVKDSDKRDAINIADQFDKLD
jgi:hypothetical protein